MFSTILSPYCITQLHTCLTTWYCKNFTNHGWLKQIGNESNTRVKKKTNEHKITTKGKRKQKKHNTKNWNLIKTTSRKKLVNVLKFLSYIVRINLCWFHYLMPLPFFQNYQNLTSSLPKNRKLRQENPETAKSWQILSQFFQWISAWYCRMNQIKNFTILSLLSSQKTSLHILLNRSSGIFCAQKFASGISWSRFPGILVIPNTSRPERSKEQKQTSNTTDSYLDYFSCYIFCQSIMYHSTNETQCYKWIGIASIVQWY